MGDAEAAQIIDDEHESLTIFSRALELDGYETATATSAEAAIELINQAPPDAIMLVLNMPYINGLGFLYRLRGSRRGGAGVGAAATGDRGGRGDAAQHGHRPV